MEDGATTRKRAMTTVIADATPLIYLAAIGQFDLLGVLYGRIVIPCAVYDEVVIQGGGRPGATETAGAAWVDRVAVSDPTKLTSLLSQLDRGESEAIVLAEELQASPPRSTRFGLPMAVSERKHLPRSATKGPNAFDFSDKWVRPGLANSPRFWSHFTRCTAGGFHSPLSAASSGQ
jgi:hypothetical protein